MKFDLAPNVWFQTRKEGGILIYTVASKGRKRHLNHWFSLSLSFPFPSNPFCLTLIMICPYHPSSRHLFVSTFLVPSALLSLICFCFQLTSAALLSEVSQSLGISRNPNRLEQDGPLRSQLFILSKVINVSLGFSRDDDIHYKKGHSIRPVCPPRFICNGDHIWDIYHNYYWFSKRITPDTGLPPKKMLTSPIIFPRLQLQVYWWGWMPNQWLQWQAMLRSCML